MAIVACRFYALRTEYRPEPKELRETRERVKGGHGVKGERLKTENEGDEGGQRRYDKSKTEA
jgi:hypothetical protein